MTRPRVNETRTGHSMYLSDGVVVRGLRLLEYRKGCRGSFLHFAWCARLIVETDNSAVITRSARSSEPDRSFHRSWERRGGWGLAAIGMQGKEIGASRSHVGCAAGVDAHTRCLSAPESVRMSTAGGVKERELRKRIDRPTASLAITERSGACTQANAASLYIWKKWPPQLQTARGVCLKEKNNKPRPV